MKKVTTKTGKEVVIRSPQMGDVEAMLDYVNELVDENTMILINEKQTLEHEKKYVEEAIKAIKGKKKIQLLAFDGEKLIGNAQAEKDRWKAEHTGIFGISIHRDYRGEGVGKVLSQAVIEAARDELGVELVRLDVFAENEAAVGLYKSLGFRETGVIPGGVKQDGKKMDRVMMVMEV